MQGLALHVENAGGDPNNCVSAFMCWGGGGREVEVLEYGDFWQFLPGSVVGSSAYFGVCIPISSEMLGLWLSRAQTVQLANSRFDWLRVETTLREPSHGCGTDPCAVLRVRAFKRISAKCKNIYID